jgi:hypothetical protein
MMLPLLKFSSLQEKHQSQSSETLPSVLPEGMAEGIANDILNVMPEDAEITQFMNAAMNEIAQKLETESEKLPLKIPTAQELIAYTGTFYDSMMFDNRGNREEIIKKLINSRYDLSDFADIKFYKEDKKEAEQIVIAAAHKGKILHVTMSPAEDGFEQILKKCTMH